MAKPPIKPLKTQHVLFTRGEYVLDYNPKGDLHGGPYWKIKKPGDNVDKVHGRIGGPGFQKYDRIKNSPVYAEGVLMNPWSRE